MSSKIKMNDFDNFNKEVNNMLSDLKDPHLRTILTTKLALTLQNQIEDRFIEQNDFEGNAWVDRKKPKISKNPRKKPVENKNLLLRKSGNLADNWDNKSDAEGFVVFNNSKSSGGFPYGLVHAFGSKHVPKRSFLPLVEKSGTYDFNDKYKECVMDEIYDFFDKELDKYKGKK